MLGRGMTTTKIKPKDAWIISTKNNLVLRTRGRPQSYRGGLACRPEKEEGVRNREVQDVTGTDIRRGEGRQVSGVSGLRTLKKRNATVKFMTDIRERRKKS